MRAINRTVERILTIIALPSAKLSTVLPLCEDCELTRCELEGKMNTHCIKCDDDIDAA